jgi:hypothetical protein
VSRAIPSSSAAFGVEDETLLPISSRLVEGAMLPVDVDAIVRAHERHAFAFQYQKDCYALSLLAHVIGGGRPISVLRRGPFARLLDKPIVKRALAYAASGVLTPACIEQALPEVREPFRVTLGRWGGKTRREWADSYYQTSRPGESLVLQLNFPESHDRAYRALVRHAGDGSPFASSFHPGRVREPFTLAWARLDVDCESDEVLIEEVQSDWVKEAQSFRDIAETWLSEGHSDGLCFTGFDAPAAELVRYVECVLAPYASVWQECVLALAIEFSYATLGARRVFFHTYEGGKVMKRMWYRRQPPRSLYTRLPERFCFTRTRVSPRMFEGDRRLEEHEVEWFSLNLV